MHVRTHAHMHTHVRTHAHARMQTHVRAHARTSSANCFSITRINVATCASSAVGPYGGVTSVLAGGATSVLVGGAPSHRTPIAPTDTFGETLCGETPAMIRWILV